MRCDRSLSNVLAIGYVRSSTEFVNEFHSTWPLAVPRGGVEMADSSNVDQPAAPCARQLSDLLDPREGIVRAGRNDARER
ncbi:hypothetical protein R69619_04009 [Paraburkholderia nemoris]|nr:hypothetical protein R69619_04009 [Paraburkholderia nemoris]